MAENLLLRKNDIKMHAEIPRGTCKKLYKQAEKL
jgi:hypothetical protein